jgi:arginine metabolism regulation protein II
MLNNTIGYSQAVLSPRQVDSILKYLDAAEHTVLSSGNDAAVCDHNFAVFASRPTRTSTSDESSFWQAPIPTNSGQCPSDEVNNASGLTEHSICDDTSHIDDLHDTYGGRSVAGVDRPVQNTILTVEMRPTSCDATDSESTLGMVEVHQGVGKDWLDAGGSPTSSPHSGLDLDHFLMRHYAERVCHLFCVIDTVKSPWKTIHLPRALMSMGELSVTGTTTTVRSALCNALLSISAWYLSNDHQRHQNTELGRRWADVAAKYGYNAIAMLKRAVDSDMYSSPKPKYKEFLASMLSMVTINVSRIIVYVAEVNTHIVVPADTAQVMSGDTHTCGVHLDGAGELLKFLWSKKRSFSAKTRSLYSIYCYLRVIYESTLVWQADQPTQREAASESVFAFFNNMDPDEAADTSPSSPQIAGDTSMFEYIYGIPQQLLAILEGTTRLIRSVDDFRMANKFAHLPEDINAACDRLENSILDWKLEDDHSVSLAADTDATREIVRHQTRAFHEALIIFFSQNIRLLDHRYLRRDVDNILESIETIEHIKAETNMLAAPIFWPAFIAATEAFDSKQQARFRKWHEEVTAYGIASVRTGIDVVNEVWKVGPSKAKRYTSLWRTTIARTGDSLMLS